MITTIITTYKRPQLLKRAVNSVLKQTYPHFQVCVYDNASDDETEEIMQEFLKKDSRVKYHRHPENIGMMANYEYGLSRVNTPYFSFLSDDDFLLPWFYETALQSFEKYPDAAFSACGVIAMDEKGVVVADPLSGWKSEGCFNVPEGMLEMISTKGNLPIPTGILFQHKLVKNIIPDWSDEIRLMWDPDYLLQIAAQHPISINKKACAVYLAHPNAFSASFYAEVRGSAQGLSGYIQAADKMFNRLMENPHIPSMTKSQVRQAFVNMIRKEFSIYMCQYILQNNFSEANITAKILNKYYGMDKRIIFLLTGSTMCKYCPPLYPIIRSLLMAAKKTIRFLRKKKQPLLGAKENLQKYQEYVDMV